MSIKTLPDIPVEPRITNSERVTMTHREIPYACTRCKRKVGRGNLVVKRVQFKEMGVGGPVIRTRTTDWLCVIPHGEKPSCRDSDADWNTDKFKSAPGMADTRIAIKKKGRKRA